MTDSDLAFASIEQIGKLYRDRKLSPVELTKLMLSRIELLNPKLNAFITVAAEIALAQAKKAEAELLAPRGRKGHRDRGPLHGIPISLKDNIYTKDIRTTAGSKILKDFIPQHDAQVVTQLKKAGAVLLGKTNLHEFAYGVTSNNPHYGPARNPWDLTRIPGGSSGGSAAAVAAGLCYGSIGTDTGGSIRIPAALCGIVGLKPTYRRVSTANVVPLSRQLDHVGPLARTAVDAALILHALTPENYIHETGRKAPIPFDLRGANEIRQKPPSPLGIGIPKDYFWDRIDEEVREIQWRTVQGARRHGVVLHEVPCPSVHSWAEPSTQIALADATAFHQQAGWFPSRAAEYGEDVRTRLQMGLEVRATDYLHALELRRTAAVHLLSQFKIQALIVPANPIPAPLIGEEEVKITGKSEPVRTALLRLHRPGNFAEVPAVSVPCGFTSAGLPVGIQLIGHCWMEKTLLRIAHAFERTLAPLPRPPL
jgi:aspartyl-tRNA(Asn)/glutamyl-tRNA(Gln) amidotransferase subunit A